MTLWFDNTDHNVRTLDGLHVFHCLGGITAYTPSDSVDYEGGSKKQSKMPTENKIASRKTISIVPHGFFKQNALKTIDHYLL